MTLRAVKWPSSEEVSGQIHFRLLVCFISMQIRKICGAKLFAVTKYLRCIIDVPQLFYSSLF